MRQLSWPAIDENCIHLDVKDKHVFLAAEAFSRMAVGLAFPYAVETIVFFACACSYSLHTLQNEFIYQAVSEELNYTANHSVNYCAPIHNESEIEQLVADEVSRWTMYVLTSTYITCAVFALLLTSWSDKIGRKKAIAFPAVGNIVAAGFQAFIIIYQLPLYWLVVNGLLYGCFGAYSALINIGSAYLSDTVGSEKRGMRYTILEVSASFGGGLVQIATGYWINAHGFISSSFFVLGCAFISLLFVTLLPSENMHEEELDESKRLLPIVRTCEKNFAEERPGLVKDRRRWNKVQTSSDEHSFLGQLKVVWKIYTSEPEACNQCKREAGNGKHVCIHETLLGGKRIWRLWFYVLSFAIYMFSINGTESFQIMFFVSYPVCFTPDLVGAQAGLNNGIIILTPFAIFFCETFFRLGGQSFVFIGIVVRMMSFAMMSLARGPILIFIATSFAVLYKFPTPFMRSELSTVVSASEQGSALSVMSGVESLVNIFSPIAYLILYPATLSVYHGFAWSIAVLILCVPLGLITSISIANSLNRRRKRALEETSEI